jgi:hypothetical protein
MRGRERRAATWCSASDATSGTAVATHGVSVVTRLTAARLDEAVAAARTPASRGACVRVDRIAIVAGLVPAHHAVTATRCDAASGDAERASPTDERAVCVSLAWRARALGVAARVVRVAATRSVASPGNALTAAVRRAVAVRVVSQHRARVPQGWPDRTRAAAEAARARRASGADLLPRAARPVTVPIGVGATGSGGADGTGAGGIDRIVGAAVAVVV